MSDIPTHVGLILDGNRRWAKEKGFPTLEGHRVGYKKVKDIGDYLLEKGVSYVSVYTFSTENWKRSEDEVEYLMDLTEMVLQEDVEEMHRKNIRIRVLGSKTNLRPQILQGIEDAEAKTANNTKGTVALCFNYGGQEEIVDATKEIMKAKVDLTKLSIDTFSKYLYAPDIPPVDLMVRTAGEQRISGFMLWRLNYAELYFSQKLWPDFSEEDMDEALAWFTQRDRRFGGNSTRAIGPTPSKLTSQL